MPKDYVNQSERELVGVGCIALSNMKTKYMHDWLGKDERKYLKSAITFWDKFIQEWIKRVGNKDAQKILHDMDTMNLFYTSLKHKRTISVAEDVAAVITDITELVMCPACLDPCREDCKIRDLLVAMDTEKRPGSVDGMCRYYEVEDDE